MITAVFTDNDDYAHAYGLWQWDYGQQLRIEGLHLPTAVEIHFALQETGGEAITRVGTTKDGVTTVTIPDSMLEGNSTAWTADKAYNIYAWVYLSDKSSGETIKRITMQVKSRPKPEAFEAPGDGEIFRQAIEAVNDAANRAEDAGDKAVVAADEAKAAATQTAEHLEAVQGLAEQVETNADTVAQDKQTVAGMLSQTQQAASEAVLSAQAAKLSETAAGQAQTGAEAAEDTARQYAEETEADRQAVANDKQAVSQMREDVAADCQAVEQTAAQFGQTAQDALTAIGQAQSTAVGDVKAEGQKQTTAVQEVGTQAVSEVAEAKTIAVEAVTTEGDKQTKRVEDAAAGIVADREQIGQNKTDIAGLVEGMTDLAPAIHSTASGSVITANDAAEGRPFRGLRVFGRTEQVQTTGAQLINTQGAGNSRGVDWVFDKGVVTFSGVTVDTSTNRVNCAVNVKDVMEIGKTYFAKSFTVGIASDVAVEKPSGVIYTREYTPDGTETGICIRVLVDKSNDAGIEIDLTAYVAITENERLSSWEPYTGGKPSPSPEYPQEIVSAGESGTINVSISDSGSQSQSLTLATPNGLPGVPVSKDGNYTDSNGQQWVCDEIDLERGKYVQRVKEINPADYDRWISDKTTGNLRFKIIGTDAAKKTVRSEILSNRFTFLSSGHMLGGSFTYNSDVYFYLPSTVTTVEECKQWFVDNQTTIYYQLETPIERDLTPEEIAAYKALHTNYPTTVISNDAGAHMEVAYVADTKNYIHNLEERLNAKLVNIQSALISQKISGGWGGIKVTDSSRVPVVRFAMWGKTEQVRTSGKNLFDISSLKKYEINNNNLKASVVDGKIILEGKGVTTKEVIFFCLNKTDDLLKLNPGKYTLSFKSNMPTGTAHESKTVEAFAIIKKADGSSDYSSTGNKGWTTFDIAEGDMMYLRFDINNGTMSAEFYDIQLEYGSSATAYEPYSGNFPSPSPDWEQPIEITDQPVTVTVKGGTEQQSITLSPPKPMTKWDKLEKVDGVWCWVYQSRWVESYTDENITGEYISTTGELNAGAEVYCKADTSESIPLSPSEQAQLNALMMYAPETEITNTGGCNMELTYTVDTKSYIDKKIAEISTAVLEV